MSLEFLNRLIGLAPWYIQEFLQLLAHPGEVLRDEPDLTNAVLFYSLSVILSIFLDIFLEPFTIEFLVEISISVVFHAVSVALFAAIGFVCWRIVRARASIRSVINLFFYSYGVAILIISMGGLLARGVIKVWIPADYDRYKEYVSLVFIHSPKIYEEPYNTLGQTNELLWSILILAASCLLLVAWLLRCWIAYGACRSVTRIRSIAALILFLILSYPATFLITSAYMASGRDPF